MIKLKKQKTKKKHFFNAENCKLWIQNLQNTMITLCRTCCVKYFLYLKTTKNPSISYCEGRDVSYIDGINAHIELLNGLPSQPTNSAKWLATSKAAGAGPPYSISINTTCQNQQISAKFMENFHKIQPKSKEYHTFFSKILNLFLRVINIYSINN